MEYSIDDFKKYLELLNTTSKEMRLYFTDFSEVMLDMIVYPETQGKDLFISYIKSLTDSHYVGEIESVFHTQVDVLIEILFEDNLDAALLNISNNDIHVKAAVKFRLSLNP